VLKKFNYSLTNKIGGDFCPQTLIINNECSFFIEGEIADELKNNRVASLLLGWPGTDEHLPIEWRKIVYEILMCCQHYPMEIITLIVHQTRIAVKISSKDNFEEATQLHPVIARIVARRHLDNSLPTDLELQRK